MIQWFGISSKADPSSKFKYFYMNLSPRRCSNDRLNRFNEEMIETLFGYAPAAKNKLPTKKDAAQEAPKYIQIIDAKKAQNLSIMLKALCVTTDEVRDALEEGYFASPCLC